LFYYRTRNDREIDFLIKQGATITELVQSVYEINDPDIERREVKALVEAGQELGVDKLTAITWDEKKEIKKDGFTVNFLPVWERFLD